MASEEPQAKVAKTSEESYFKVIEGVKCDRKLWETIEECAKDGQVSYVEVKKIWAEAQDAQVVTDTERDTINHGMKTFRFTVKAVKAMNIYLTVGKHQSYYKVIKGVKYDRVLLEMANKFQADGQISVKDAKMLFAEVQDGKGITGTERNTLEYIAKEMTFTAKATEYFDEVIKLPGSTKYYKTIAGTQYDAGLLLEIEDSAKDGTVSLAEAERIWKSAQDGPGVTDIEKATMKYALTKDKSKFTDPAYKFLDEKLGGA